MFFSYGEIWRAQPIRVPEKKPIRWSQMTPTPGPSEGVLLTPRKRDGFTRRVKSEVLLAPSDRDEFLKHIPPQLVKL
jgi:hypothetical protein